MKNLHFYIQCVMVLIALGFAVQIPLQPDLFFYVGIIEFFLGIYQMGMSFILISKLSRKSNLLKIHCFGSIGYLMMLIVMGLLDADKDLWLIALFVLPWGLALLFLVTIDELERARHYRL